MASTNNEDEGPAPRPSFAQYQLHLYEQGILLQSFPPVTSNPVALEDQARRAMSARARREQEEAGEDPGEGLEAFNYVFGGSGEHSTMDANRLAFRRWKLLPRMLMPTDGAWEPGSSATASSRSTPVNERKKDGRDLSVHLFGERYETPILMAPVGVQGIVHADAERGVATACAELGVPFVMSTASTTGIKDVAAAMDAAVKEENAQWRAEDAREAKRWFQLYWPLDDEITASVLSRAKEQGFKVLVVTLDTFMLAWRPLDIDRAYLPFATGTGNTVGFEDPVFRRKFKEKFGGDEVEDNIVMASRYWTSEAFSGHAHRWEDLAKLRKMWGDDPIVLKGILDPRDAELAVRYGMDGIIVSNHGGRQLDGAVSSLEILPEIVDKVGDKITVLFDSGIRTGADVMKALALGAKAVLVGRPVIYGLGIAGKEGARQVLASLLAEVDQSMGLAGLKRITELNRSCLIQDRCHCNGKAML